MAPRPEKPDTVIIGGGQAGLAISCLLTQQDRDHVVLEKTDRIGSSWRRRWDSFTLVTPNSWLQLPGHPYEGGDPDGFLSREEVVAYLEDYADSFEPPIRFGTTVTRLARRRDGGYRVETDDGPYRAANVVVATGTFQQPAVPAPSERVPADIQQLHSSDYRNPAQLPDGAVLVVGSGQSGSQIAWELHEAGREVYLCVSDAGRLPRRYRGRDGMWWAMQLGILDETVDELDSPAERFDANPRVSGRDGGRDINLHAFARDGVRLLGRLQDVRGGRALLGADLHDNLAAADEMAARIQQGADNLVEATGLDLPEESVEEPDDGFEQEQRDQLDLADAGIGTVIWATGYRWDYGGWIDLPVVDDYGYPVQQRGVTAYPGLYFLGLHYLHTRRSGLLLGVGDDAEHVAAHIAERARQGASVSN